MKKSLISMSLVLLVVASCTPYGHWGSYDWWHSNCPDDFPSYEEVERVVEENREIIDELYEKRLIYMEVFISSCPNGAFITFYSKNKAGALKVLDEANARAEGLTMFYGVPFRFTSVR